MRVIIAMIIALSVCMPKAYSELETMDKPQVDQNNPEASVESLPEVTPEAAPEATQETVVGSAAVESTDEAHQRNKNLRRYGLITAGVLVAATAIIVVNQSKGRKADCCR